MSQAEIAALAARIASNTAKVNGYYLDKNLPLPSFEQDGPTKSLVRPEDADIEAARQAVIFDCNELRILMQGPSEYLAGLGFYATELVAIQSVLRFRLADAVPLDGEATFAELAAKSGIAESQFVFHDPLPNPLVYPGLLLIRMRQLLRVAMAQHIFREPLGRPGVVVHTTASRILAEDDLLHQWLAWNTGRNTDHDSLEDEGWAASCHAGAAMAKWPDSGEADHTGFALAHGKATYEYLSEHPRSLKRFADMMRFMTREPGLEPDHVVNGYPWADLGEATVVDLGGSHGAISVALARKYPLLKLVVQDLDAAVIREAASRAPPEVADRVHFMVHDFMKPQPPTMSGVDVFLLRAILHNWSDKCAIHILRNLIPAMKPGAKLIVCDIVIPEPGTVPPMFERPLRNGSLMMDVHFNACDRELPDFSRLFEEAGFQFEGGYQPAGSKLHILKATLRG